MLLSQLFNKLIFLVSEIVEQLGMDFFTVKTDINKIPVIGYKIEKKVMTS